MLSQLRQVVREKWDNAAEARIALRDAVCRYVAAEYDRGTSAADVLLTVTGILQRAEKESSGAAGELAQILIDWCAEFGGKASLGGITLQPKH